MCQLTKPVLPVTGTVRWLADAPNGDRRILIRPVGGTEHVYEVHEEPDGWMLHRIDFATGEFLRYRIVRECPKVWRCSCPDAQYRCKYTCKHVKSLRAAIEHERKSQPF
jgi:hypothetical protein